MTRTEITLVIFYFIVIGLKLTGFPFSSLIFILFSSILAIYYFYQGSFFGYGIRPKQMLTNQQIKNKREWWETVPTNIMTAAISVGIIGTMMTLQNWPMSRLYLTMSLLAGMVTALLSSTQFQKNKDLFKGVFIRLAVFMLPLLILYMTPYQTLLPFTMRNNPELRDALIEMYNHPGDTLYTHKVDSIRESRFPNEPKH